MSLNSNWGWRWRMFQQHQVRDKNTLWTGCQPVARSTHVTYFHLNPGFWVVYAILIRQFCLYTDCLHFLMFADWHQLLPACRVLTKQHSYRWNFLMEIDGRTCNCYWSKTCFSPATPLFCHCQFVFGFDMHIICIMHIWSTAVRTPPRFPP